MFLIPSADKSSDKPQYFFNLIPIGQLSYNTQNLDQFETYYCRTDALKNFLRTQ